MSRPLFIYVNADSAKKPEIKEFVEFYLARGGEFASEVKYVSLSGEAYKTALSHFRAIRTGTVFGGEPKVGLKVEDLLKMEAK